MQVAKAWALREVSRELHDGQDHLPWVAGRVFKNDGTNPGRGASLQLFQNMTVAPTGSQASIMVSSAADLQ